MSIRQGFIACGVLAAAGVAGAQTDPLYITDGDSARLAIVQNGVLQSVAATHVRGYPIIATSSVWIGDYNGNQPNSIEYDLAGNATGNTAPYTPVFAVDAGQDGKQSYQLGDAFNSSSTVYVSDMQLGNPQKLFGVQGSDLVGITFDSASGNLWITDQDQFYEYTTGGQLVSQFKHGVGRGCAAYETSTDTLWYITNGSDTISQFDKSGTLLQQLSINGLASNNWGAEFASRIPSPGAATLLGLGGLVAGRRRR
jgi:MYXO-CTERM domain-containing protein